MDVVFGWLVMAANASRCSCGGAVPDRPARSFSVTAASADGRPSRCSCGGAVPDRPARSWSAGRTGVVAAGCDGEAGGDSEGDGEPKSMKRGKPFTLTGLLDVRSTTVRGGGCGTVPP